MFQIRTWLLLFLLLCGPFLETIHAAETPFDWVQRASSDRDDSGTAVAIDPAGNVHVTGYFGNAINFGSTNLTTQLSDGIFLAKYDSNGVLLWVREAGGSGFDQASGVVVDGTGNVFITGTCSRTATFSTTNFTRGVDGGFFLAKYDSQGNLLWVRADGNTNGTSRGTRVTVDTLGQAYVTGDFRPSMALGTNTLVSSGERDMFVAKYTAAGEVVWARKAGGPSQYDTGEAIGVDAQGHCFVAGIFGNTATFGTTNIVSVGGYDFFLARYDSSGVLEWVQRAGGSGYDSATALAVHPDGDCYALVQFDGTTSFGGRSYTSRGNYDILLVRYNQSGEIQWIRQAGGVGADKANGVFVDGVGNCYLTGLFNDSASFGDKVLTVTFNSDVFLAKYDREGRLHWAQKAGSVGTDEGHGIAVDVAGLCYVSGRFGNDIAFGSILLTNSSGRADLFLARRPDLGLEPVTLSPTGAVWKYYDAGTDPGAAWRLPSFVDSPWAAGRGQLGFGDGDEAAVINGGPATNRFITAYFRRTFNVAEPATLANLAGRLLRDDGAVIYLNGIEVWRSNMPEGPINFRTLALTTVNLPDETNFFAFPIPLSLLVTGQNLIAVEVHQSATNSTDLSFELEVLASTPLGSILPQISISNPARDASFTTLDSVPVTVQTSHSNAVITQVEFFFGTNFIGRSTSFPFGITLPDPLAGTHVLTARATESFGLVATSAPVNITVLFVNQPPSFAPGPDQTVLEDSGPQTVMGWAANISAGAAGETNQSLAFFLTNNAPNLFAAQPAIDPSGALMFTPAPNAFGTSIVSVVLVDGGGTANGGTDISAEYTFEIRVLPVDDLPVARAGGDQVLACAGATTAVLLDGSDSEELDGDTLIFAWRSGGTLLGTNAQLLFALSTGTHLITLEVTDVTGSSAQDSLMVSIVDQAPPVITCPASRVVEAGTAWDFDEPTAADACDGTNVAVIIISTVTNAVNGCAFVATRTWEAADGAGQRAHCSQTISVVDLTPPEFVCPSNLTLDASEPAGAMVVFTNMVASDCASEVAIESVPPSGSVLPIGTNLVTWTATDLSGNSNACEISVVVLGPRGILEDVLAELVAARPGVTNRAERQRLHRAIFHLARTTNAALWFDGRYLQPAAAGRVFERSVLGAARLRNLRAYRPTPRGPVPLPDSLVLGWMARLANANRLPAVEAVDRAEELGGDPRSIAACRALITRGDTAAAVHGSPAAIARYREAWRRAEKILDKLSR